jgi:outer membrane biosynthesis protein TonB
MVMYADPYKEFEVRKNRLAALYTFLICSILFLLFFFLSWTLPFNPPQPVEEGLEVNLGNSDQGLGTDQPFQPGDPSSRDEEKYSAPKTVAAKEALKSVETDDQDPDKDLPAVKQPPVTKPEATKIPDKDLAVKTHKAKVPATDPTPAPPRPKAVFQGVNGTGNGGNDADHYKPGGNEGIAGGRGDQGAPGGNPDSKNYKGGGTGSGVAILRGLQGRSWRSLPSFTDEFNENAKVAVDIHVDAAGNVTSADYQPLGSTTADATMKAIALRKARQIKFNAGSDESVGTLIFNFKLKN